MIFNMLLLCYKICTCKSWSECSTMMQFLTVLHFKSLADIHCVTCTWHLKQFLIDGCLVWNVQMGNKSLEATENSSELNLLIIPWNVSDAYGDNSHVCKAVVGSEWLGPCEIVHFSTRLAFSGIFLVSKMWNESTVCEFYANTEPE